MRTRVVVFLVLITMIALVATGLVSYALQRGAYMQRMDDSLERTVQEIRILAEQGVDPDTGQPFTESDQMVYVAMMRHMPSEYEGMLGLNETGIVWQANASVETRLEDDPQLVDLLTARAQAGQNTSVTVESIPTDTHDWRIVTIPISFPDDVEPSVLAVGIDVDLALSSLNNTFLTYALTGLIVLILTGLIGALLVGRLLAPLRELQSTAAEISTDEDLDRRVPIWGEDDVARLSEDFNNMLDRLQGSFNSQRQLLDDVGHEIRTPMTIVQGNLELMRSHDVDDVERVRTISLDELDRATRLTEDLVTLAKASRPDFLRTTSINIENLTHEVASKAEQLGPRIWAVESTADIPYVLDEQRITQAWLQLANNAVKYSDPDSRVWIGSKVEVVANDRESERWLNLWVTDEGMGVEPQDATRIFERFGRGGNVQRTSGSGLGLNIVLEIVRAHQGTVSVRSTPGAGSTFIIHLPLID